MFATLFSKRFVYLLHRWSGIAACILMVLWLVSGVVMLFVGHPKLLPAERLAALPTLPQQGCCIDVQQALAQVAHPEQVASIALTTVANQVVYRLQRSDGRLELVDAMNAQTLPAANADTALASAQAFLPQAKAQMLGLVDDDRWTHSPRLDAHRPLFKVQMQDPATTWLYVSSRSGEVVLDAPRDERYWSMLGAWLHWLYMFRNGSKDAFWSWLVIGLSALCTLSAIAGAFVGVWRWRFSGRYKSGSRSPYRSLAMRWHHITGLLFGLILLAWIFSGLMSMNPFGVFNAQGPAPDRKAYQPDAGHVQLATAPADILGRLLSQGFAAKELHWLVLDQQPYVLAFDGQARTKLIVASADGTGFSVQDQWLPSDLQAAGAKLLAAPIVKAEVLERYDAYYYQRQAASMYAGDLRGLPALRLDFGDANASSVYLDLHSGQLALSVNRAQRLSRWLFNFLHSWDLPLFLQWSYLREAALIALSIGALFIAVTGLVIAWKYLRASLMKRRTLRTKASPSPAQKHNKASAISTATGESARTASR
ncbi:PepSY domain-containing protein [Lampropedia puyangensis]|uniref:PepSY domain-containing protein n=1 Tax=Lampropedia puyangensis TaxID=1330072 RepID=A0A4S8EVB7_9BURK|nr:PepSY-associated TM helix domain-containing protein [Lampropedia puyangensis]THT98712.1 PepSY domain-containing protein [Lampropedia puyangensis]